MRVARARSAAKPPANHHHGVVPLRRWAPAIAGASSHALQKAPEGLNARPPQMTSCGPLGRNLRRSNLESMDLPFVA
ncbi:hypothetical protein Spa11_28330 [Botrimarina mediterranea]|uniref:Uncharacterized protein n=1 Tax=Botrimarina mediterranea TaxID=2528022 RepID=A0A518KA00_9BACT|nr:hypothetical protein Spa11_28330 [Botrimarina mediterranea]